MSVDTLFQAAGTAIGDGEHRSLTVQLRFFWHDRIHGRALYRRIVRMYGPGRVRDVFHVLG